MPTRLAAVDPVVGGIGAGPPLMLWHDDGLELPAVAKYWRTAIAIVSWLSRREWAYGLQFHPGATVDIVRRWAVSYRAPLRLNCFSPVSGGDRSDPALDGAEAVQASQQAATIAS